MTELTKKTTGFLAEFRQFIARGNVLDMAVGVIIGGAFGQNFHLPGQRYPDAPALPAHRRRGLLPMAMGPAGGGV